MPRISGIQGKKGGWWRLVQVFITYFVITVVAAFVIGLLIGGFEGVGSVEREEIPISTLISDIAKGDVEKVTVEEEQVDAVYKDGSEVYARKEQNTSFYEIPGSAGVDVGDQVEIEIATPMFGDMFGLLLSNLLPIVVMIVFFLFLFRQAGKSAGGVFDFGKSTARVFTKDRPKVSFKDAAGVDEAKKELEEVVDFLRNSQKYRKLGARIPKGVLLVGPAGTGKTLLAKAVANEANVPFFSMAGSEFMEMLVGVGASRVRDLFKQAKENAPALIFIDELESIGRHRGRSVIASNAEQEQTLNQILVEMDGFSPNDNVIVLAATNRPDLLDSALTRPGRFDRTVVLQLPDIKGREEIIKIHLRNKPIAKDVDTSRLAKITVGFSGADIENMLNEAAILAASNGKSEISFSEIKESVTKVRLGRERRRVQSEEDRRITAYHEAGHAVVSKCIPGMDPVHRVSIVSRGLALGFTEINPEQDRQHQTKTDLENRITALLGGRAAEKLGFDDMTVGAGNDLEKASLIAHKMVTEYGMSELGPISYTDRAVGGDPIEPIPTRNRYSEEMGARIDREVKEIIDRNYRRAQKILEENREMLDELAELLMREETVEQETLDELVKRYSHAG